MRPSEAAILGLDFGRNPGFKNLIVLDNLLVEQRADLLQIFICQHVVLKLDMECAALVTKSCQCLALTRFSAQGVE